ncbi:LD-carboxypeptidase [Carnobacterium gallinarum]|uniref:LD-carboxypeptidase n=1 Tax=Carnobacterium gallinarum TaxID=2749 RepID=UPI000554E2C8|nr:LD-carboxypeptidase [Carnobacterium gallinarum]
MLKYGDTIGIVACSNGKAPQHTPKINQLLTLLKEKFNLTIIFSKYIYQQDTTGANGPPKEKAASLMELYKNPAVQVIFDISGGNLANELLPYLDFNLMKEHPKPFVGYSDLTVLLNGIYEKTRQIGVNYQLLHLVGENSSQQQDYFYQYFFTPTTQPALSITPLTLTEENSIQGTLLGGNSRCLLKLAGTDYWPSIKQKILFLEANGGDISTIATYLAQLDQLHCFRDCKAVLLGQFSQIDSQKQRPELEKLIKNYVAPYSKSIYQTMEVGHSSNSKALKIGGEVCLLPTNQLTE